MHSLAPFWQLLFHSHWYSCHMFEFSLPSWRCHQPLGGKRPFPPVPPISHLLPSSMAQPVWLTYSPNLATPQKPRSWCPWLTRCSHLCWIHWSTACKTVRWKELWWNYGEEKWIYIHSECVEKPCDIWSCVTALYLSLLMVKIVYIPFYERINLLSSPSLKIYEGNISL